MFKYSKLPTSPTATTKPIASSGNIRSFFSNLFFPVRSTSSSRQVNAPIDQVLTFLHDPVSVIKLDPLVSTCTQSTTNTGLWSVVDRVKILKWWPWNFPTLHVGYTANFHSTPNGVTIDVVANRLLTMKNTWHATANKEGTEVFMEVQSKVFFYFYFNFSFSNELRSFP
jgi:hypothetical protein